MPFDDIQSLAQQTAKDEAEKRKQQLAIITNREAAAQQADDQGIIGLVKANPKVALSPGAAKEYNDFQFAASNRQKRNTYEAQHLPELPSVDDLVQKWAGPAASFATESPEFRKTELTVDPRGRETRLEALKNEMTGGGVPAGPASPFSVGTGAHGEPYFTNLSRGELHAEHQDANAIRGASGLPDEPPPVTDLHPLHMGGGGGTFSNLGGRIGDKASPENRAKDALLRSLDLETRAAKEAPLTDREQAGSLLQHEPVWDQKAADNGYTATKNALLQATASGAVPPEISGHLQKKYDTYYEKALKDDPARAEEGFIEQVNARREVPKAAVVHAATQPSAMDTAKADLGAATQAHGEAVAGGPGTTVSPVYRVLASASRYGLPIAGAAVGGAGGLFLGGPGAAVAGGAAGGAIGGGLGEKFAEDLEGTPTDPKEILLNAVIGGALPVGGKVAGMAGRGALGLAERVGERYAGVRAAPAIMRAAQLAKEVGDIGGGVGRAAGTGEFLRGVEGIGRAAQVSEGLRASEGAAGMAQTIAGALGAEGAVGPGQIIAGARAARSVPELARFATQLMRHTPVGPNAITKDELLELLQKLPGALKGIPPYPHGVGG